MLKTIDKVVDTAMASWQIPGLAIAVVRGDQVVHLSGYGVRDSATTHPVSINTAFLLCSLTKAFTVAGLGLLVEEAKLKWSTRIRDVLPEFRLRDPVASENVTFTDLLCHRTGLPAHDRVWSPGDLSREDLLSTLRHLQASSSIREIFQYSNLGYMVAGVACERVSGQSWEDFIGRRLLAPMGFSHHAFSTDELSALPDHAHPHELSEGMPTRGVLWPMNAAPAGSLIASIDDLSRWLTVLCAGGRADVLSKRVLKEMLTPRIYVGENDYPELGSRHYGFGFFCESYRGLRLVSHTGSQPGWGTYIGMLPDEQIGVAVLTNCDPTPVRELLAYTIFDLLTGRSDLNWYDRFLAGRESSIQQERADKDSKEARRGKTVIPRGLEEYVGDYNHPAYGCMRISRNTEVLTWSWRGLNGVLFHCNNDAFDVVEFPVARYSSGLEVTFLYDRMGVIDRLISPLEPMVDSIVFKKILNPS